MYPPIEPYDHGHLDTGDGHLVYWEACGNPAGKPALVVHGGPGAGCTPNQRRGFDPERYRVILFDQRNCGRSLPHAADPATDLTANTTAHLVADMERLREHLGVDRWLLYGGSWGSTLMLAYAQAHPERVSEMVVCGVTMTRRSEIDWLYRGVGRFFPEQWERFRDGASAAGRGDRSLNRPDGLNHPGDPDDPDGLFGLLAAYARLVADPDPAVRAKAAHDWTAWEDTVISLEVNGKPDAYSDRPPADLLALVRICSHYFSNAAWLEEGVLLREAHRLAGIPGVLIHGRFDLGSPLRTAWQLARAWPEARLVVVEDSGHTGSGTMGKAVRAALDGFADR
ncbi:alpha/beta fold hydrolase [Planomonospora sp. ID82291]|uniref:alpha/beta fold hydrolase n=1 Tax=Planomonospora sp. ID82291 TaxID=2738136 RepID=UPI0018C36FE6|nr:alpha/beta fold hydrolase [Planomonospora sp. ID82291]MBG0816475.1 alpha/beta fold hydrolase [Planomonospora sp. ID82291]